MSLVYDVDRRGRQNAFAGKAKLKRVEQQVVIGHEDLSLRRLIAHTVDPAVVMIEAAVGV